MVRIILLPLLAAFALAAVMPNTASDEKPNLSTATIRTLGPSDQTTILVDTFNNTALNALGYYHGVSGDVSFEEFEEVNGGNYLKVTTGNVDASFVTSLAEGCTDFSAYQDHYIHIQYSGSPKFSVSLQQHNKDCDDAKLPFPETWDSVQAARYASKDGLNMYIPISHFRINHRRVNAIALENWYTKETTFFFTIEILPANAVPRSVSKVKKLDTGMLYVSCTRPNLIAFGIDDGAPALVQRTLQIIKDEKIPVTFFATGTALQYGVNEGNFTNAYREMINQGHQIALHTMTHPHTEGLKEDKDIDMEIARNIDIMRKKLNIRPKYFRPPYGTVGARTRQSVARYITNSRTIMWSIDIKDWIYGLSGDGDPDRLQYKAFKEALDKGGDIVVMHYLYKSSVDQFRDMIRLAKSKGRQFVRMDQCVGDPEAPELWGWRRG